MMDSYISDELLIETNHEVLRHLENCADCRYEMSSRRALKSQLRHAVKNSTEMQLDPIFASRTAANLRDAALSPGWLERITGDGRHSPVRLAVVGFACLVLVVTGAMVWMNRSETSFLSFNNNSSIANAVRASWNELTSLAVGDHENCAVKYNLKEDPITLDEAATKFGAYNKDLDKLMMAAFKSDAKVSGGVEFVESHSCVYEGRRFAHVVVKHNGKMVSVLMTDTDLPGEGYDVKTAIYDGAIGAAGFVAGHHAVFVVSQLAESENIMLADAIAPAIRSHVGKPTM